MTGAAFPLLSSSTSRKHSVMTDAVTNTQWNVLINDEEQYGLYPAELSLPAGWREAGFRGSEDACMAFVDEHWVDMRPASLRRAMTDAAAH